MRHESNSKYSLKIIIFGWMEGMAFNARLMPSIILSQEICHTGSLCKPLISLYSLIKWEMNFTLWRKLSASLQ